MAVRPTFVAVAAAALVATLLGCGSSAPPVPPGGSASNQPAALKGGADNQPPGMRKGSFFQHQPAAAGSATGAPGAAGK